MPEPEKQKTDLKQLLSDVVLLQQSSMPNIEILYNIVGTIPLSMIDKTMINQALTNLIKNAGEAIDSLFENTIKKNSVTGKILVTLSFVENCFIFSIKDNGIGLPENSISLFEPYVTTRSEGT